MEAVFHPDAQRRDDLSSTVIENPGFPKTQGQGMANTYKGKSLAPGGGGRFQRLKDSLMAKGKSADSAGAIAAAVGRAKYGASKFASMAAKGRARAQ